MRLVAAIVVLAAGWTGAGLVAPAFARVPAFEIASFAGMVSKEPMRPTSKNGVLRIAQFADRRQNRTRLRVYRPNSRPPAGAVRECVSRLVPETRQSGTVIVPRTLCWWRQG